MIAVSYSPVGIFEVTKGREGKRFHSAHLLFQSFCVGAEPLWLVVHTYAHSITVSESFVYIRQTYIYIRTHRERDLLIKGWVKLEFPKKHLLFV